MSDQLDSMIISKNFSGILGKLYNEPHVDDEDSLCDRCYVIAKAVYKGFSGSADDPDTCLAILQVMLNYRWTWTGRDDDVHLLLPLRRQLVQLGIDPVDRNKYYQYPRCVEAAIDRGDHLTKIDLDGWCR